MHLFSVKTGYLMLLSAIAVTASAQEDSVDFSLGAGLQHNSELFIDELDAASEKGDTANVFELGLDGNWKATERFSVSGGLNLTDKDYDQASNFDNQIQRANVGASLDVTYFDIGMDHYRAEADLNDEKLLSLSRSSLNVSKLFGHSVFVRLEASQTDKDFEQQVARSADVDGIDGSVYYFFDQGNSFVTVGLNRESQNAQDEVYDFDGTTSRIQLSTKSDWFNIEHQFQLSWKNESRDYSVPAGDQTEPRYDERYITQLSWKLNFSDELSLINDVSRKNYRSGESQDNYNAWEAGTLLEFTF